MGFYVNISLKNRVSWTLVTIILFSVIIASIFSLVPIVQNISGRVTAYNDYAKGFIIITGIYKPSLDWNDFHVELNFKNHPEQLGLNSTYEERQELLRFWENLTITEMPKRYPFTKQNFTYVENMDNVAKVYHLLNMESSFPDPTELNAVWGISTIGVDLDAAQAAFLPFGDMESGHFIQQDEYACVLNFRFNHDFNFSGKTELPLEIFDFETIEIPISGVFSSLLPPFLDPGYSIIVNEDLIWDILQVAPSDRRYNGMLIKINDPDKAVDLVKSLRSSFSPVSVYWAKERVSRNEAILNSINNTLQLIQNLSISLALVTLVSVSYMDYQRRIKDIMHLLSIGWRQGDVFKLLIVRSSIIGGLSLAIGYLLTHLIGEKITSLLISPSLVIAFNLHPVVPDPRLTWLVVLLGLVVSSSSALLGYVQLRKHHSLLFQDSENV